MLMISVVNNIQYHFTLLTVSSFVSIVFDNQRDVDID